MGKHGRNTTGKAEKLKAKARAKRKLLKKATARAPARPQKPAAKAMDVDAFLAGNVERRPLAPNVNVYRVAVPF